MQILHAFSCMINCSRIVTCMHIFMPEACMHSSCMHENACNCANLLACLMHASCMHCMHAACMPACMIHACSAGMHSLEGNVCLESTYIGECLISSTSSTNTTFQQLGSNLICHKGALYDNVSAVMCACRKRLMCFLP